MLVSIVIPIYNRAEMVKPTLESVKKQTHRPLHLVLVDNNSTDNTLSVLNEFKTQNETNDFKIDVIEEKKPGACAARNAGAKLVQSEWLMFFDSDDTMDSCLVSKYVEKIKSHGNAIDVVTTDAYFVKGDEVSRVNFVRSNFFSNHIFHSCLSTQRYIMKKILFDQVGGWNESVECWNDWELGIRLLLKSPRIAVMDEGVWIRVNVHDDSITGNRYSQNPHRREKAISIAIKYVEESDFINKSRIIRLLQMRKFVLAGLYLKEGEKCLAERYYNEALNEIRNDTLLKVLAPIVFRYVSLGGRGVDRLIRMFVR